MISARYLTPLLALLLLALVPTIQHGYAGGNRQAPKLSASHLPARLQDVQGVDQAPTASWKAWVAGTYGADSFVERRYQLPGRGEIAMFVVRGFDMKKLYHHPELGILRGRGLLPARSGTLPDGGEPVHVIANSGEGEAAVYAFVYDGRWIGNPYLLQLTSAVTSLWHGSQPLTLLFAYGDVLDGEAPAAATAVLMRETAARIASAGGETP